MSKKFYKNIILAILTIAIVAFLYYGYRREMAYMDKCQEELFQKQIYELDAKLYRCTSFSSLLCRKNSEDLSELHRKGDYIYSNYTYEMQIADTCKSFDELKNAIRQFRKEHGILDFQKSLKYSVDSLMAIINFPQKYKKSIEYYNTYYEYCNLLYEKSLNPNDSDNYRESYANVQKYNNLFGPKCERSLDSLKQKLNKMKKDYAVKKSYEEYAYEIIKYGYDYDSFLYDFLEGEKKIVSRIYEQNRIDGENYLKENKKCPGVIELKDGLQYRILKRGKGEKINESSIVTLFYKGRFVDGTIFDECPNPTDKFWIGGNVNMDNHNIVKGLYEALTLMSEGDVWEVTIPYNLAFDYWQVGPIKPYSTLIFNLKIDEVKNYTREE